MEIQPSKQYNLGQLQFWLELELSTGLLIFFAYFFPFFNFLLLGIAALLFTPYLITVLVEERRFGWIALFGITVILPSLATYMYFKESDYLFAASFLPLGCFYTYCGVLRYVIPEWFE